MPPPTNIIALTGFMAAGKSTVGRALAGLLSWSFIDLDCEIERAEGETIREIFARRGEVAFRELESQTLRTMLKGAKGAAVIALGGGTFIQPKNAELLRASGAGVVFLEVPIEQLLQRCRAISERCEQNPRPLAEDEPAFCALYAQRLPHYRQADLIVDAEGQLPEEIARAIASALDLMTRDASER